MKKTIIPLLLALLALGTPLRAQYLQPNPDEYCTGWHNPTSFTYAGGVANTKWEGLIGTKPSTASTCASGLPWSGTTVPASQLANQNSGSSCTNVNTSNFFGANDMNSRFSIKGNGNAAETGNRLTFLPAIYTDGVNHTAVPGYTSSIRLGNFCGGTEAEALRYEFDVVPGNALMTIWYALSLQSGEHSAAENPEFVVFVERNFGTDTNPNWQRIGGDTLCYIQPTPVGSGYPGYVAFNQTGFYSGTTGTTTDPGYGNNVYMPWNKVTIPLYNYLYNRVRITIGAGDCAFSAHYACAYIAGDCAPMQITGSGCSSGENDTVTYLHAPANMRTYQWYKNKTKHVLTNDEASCLDSLEILPGATDSIYCCRARDFAVEDPETFDTIWLSQTTLVCATGSLMNVNQPDLLVTSYVNLTLGNSKPTISVDTLLVDCENRVTLHDRSVAQYTFEPEDTVDSLATEWEFYESEHPLRNEAPFATATGPYATVQFANSGAHSFKIKVRSFKRDMNGEPTCWNKTTIPIRSMSRPTISTVYDSIICAGEEVVFHNTTQQTLNNGVTYNRVPQNGSTWHFWDGQGLDTTYTSFGDTWSLTLNQTTDFTLTTYVSSIAPWMHDTNRDGFTEPVRCYNTGHFRVRAEQYPNLTITGDTIVCEGQLSTIQVDADVPVQRYKWCTRLDSNFVVQTGNTMQEVPQGAKTYYVMAATPNNCISWDSLSIRMVNPKLTVPVTQMCDGEYLYLYGTGASTYTWQATPNDNSMTPTQYGDTLRVSPKQTTTYSMVGHGTNGCNADAKTETIKVFHYPEMAFEMSPDFIDSEEPVVTFSDVSKYAVRSLWDFGNGVTSTERQLSKTFTSLTEDSIYITLTSYNELNCASDTGFYVPVSLFSVWFPTAFTPTLSTNRTFHLFTKNQLEHFSIYIYDRRGDLVFYSTDQNFEWDGKHKGRYCDQGTYVYVCSYRRPGTTDIVTRKGTLLMLQ